MIRAELNNTGSLTLRWKAVNNSSNGPVVYAVSRRIGSTVPPGPFTGIGSIGTRSFTDASIPVGSSVVTYVITPQRGQSTGTPSDEFVVRFGTVGGGMAIASQGVEGNPAVKMAA
jgi:hypothetical protein